MSLSRFAGTAQFTAVNQTQNALSIPDQGVPKLFLVDYNYGSVTSGQMDPRELQWQLTTGTGYRGVVRNYGAFLPHVIYAQSAEFSVLNLNTPAAGPSWVDVTATEIASLPMGLLVGVTVLDMPIGINGLPIPSQYTGPGQFPFPLARRLRMLTNEATMNYSWSVAPADMVGAYSSPAQPFPALPALGWRSPAVRVLNSGAGDFVADIPYHPGFIYAVVRGSAAAAGGAAVMWLT